MVKIHDEFLISNTRDRDYCIRGHEIKYRIERGVIRKNAFLTGILEMKFGAKCN